MYITDDVTPCNEVNTELDIPMYNPEIWFAKTDTAAAASARQLCLTKCEERLQCLGSTLRWELKNNYVQPGIFGGLDEYERRTLLKKQTKRQREKQAAA